MDIGDEIVIKGKIVDFDANPHGAAVQIEVKGFVDKETHRTLKPFGDGIKFWIHRLDQPNVIVR